MSNKNGSYDVIVVGGRCAGSPTAMLLARKGYRVLLADKDKFPSDTISTHLIHPPGVAALKRWGLLDKLMNTGCPRLESYTFDFGPFAITGTPRAVDGVATAVGPRRTVLDHLLLGSAAEAGAEVREEFRFEELVYEGDKVVGIKGCDKAGNTVTERASVVVGADGFRSKVAEQAGAEAYEDRPTYGVCYYSYWSGLDIENFRIYMRPGDRGRELAAVPTHDGLHCIVAFWPYAEFHQNKSDVEGNFMAAMDLAPDLAEQLRKGKRETKFFGQGDVPNFVRKPYGSGWALVGDAGYHRDPCTAQGISDAFRDAELLADAIDAGLSGKDDLDAALAGYQKSRDAAMMPMFELTCSLAPQAAPPPEQMELFGALNGNQQATNDFVSVIAGTVPVPEFFAPENVQQILEAAKNGEPA